MSFLTTLGRFVFFVLFFFLLSLSFIIIAHFIMVPFTHKTFQSFFYSLLLSLEGAKTVIDYSRLTMFRAIVACVLFWSTENMRSNHIFEVVYFHPIVKKKRFCYTDFSFSETLCNDVTPAEDVPVT